MIQDEGFQWYDSDVQLQPILVSRSGSLPCAASAVEVVHSNEIR